MGKEEGMGGWQGLTYITSYIRIWGYHNETHHVLFEKWRRSIIEGIITMWPPHLALLMHTNKKFKTKEKKRKASPVPGLFKDFSGLLSRHMRNGGVFSLPLSGHKNIRVSQALCLHTAQLKTKEGALKTMTCWPPRSFTGQSTGFPRLWIMCSLTSPPSGGQSSFLEVPITTPPTVPFCLALFPVHGAFI
jgi:hypothetical protein